MNIIISQEDCFGASMGQDIVILNPDFSDDILDDRTGVLCGGGGISVNYNQDFDYIDTDSSTQSGVRLLVFTSDPDLDGWTTLDKLLEHPGLLTDEEGNPLVVGSDSSFRIAPNGPRDTPFGLTRPSRVWLVPVIIHNMEPGPGGSYFENDCIFLVPSESVSIIMVNSDGPNPEYFEYSRELEQFLFTMKGGLPEYDPEIFEYYFHVVDAISGDSLDIIRHSRNVFGFRPLNIKRVYNILGGTANGPGCDGSIIGLPLSIPQPILYIQDTATYTGEQVCLPVTVEEFVEIDSFTFALNWDPEVLAFSDIGGIDFTTFSSGQFSYDYNEGEDFVTVTWTGGDGPVTLDDGAVLLELCLDAVGGNGDRSDVRAEGSDHRFYIGHEYLPPNIGEGTVRLVTENFIDFSYSEISCVAAATRRVHVVFSVVGKYPPFTVSLDPEYGGPFTLETNRDTVYAIPQGDYTITITDSEGNQGIKANQRIESPGNSFDLAIDDILTMDLLCHGAATGQIGLEISGADIADVDLYYSTGGDTIALDSSLIKNLEAGSYHIWGKSTSGCADTASQTVTLFDPVALEALVPDGEVNCDDPGFMIDISEGVAGGSGILEYSLDGGQYHALSSDTVLYPGSYTIQVRDENGCTVSDEFSIISSGSPVSFSFEVGGDTLFVEKDSPFDVMADVNSGDGELEYDWLQDGGQLLGSDQNQAEFVFGENGIVELTIADPGGCSFTDILPIVVRDKEEETDVDITMANVITPNYDGRNERLTIWPVQDVNTVYRMRIFDRYGNLLWNKEGLNPADLKQTGWNGETSNGQSVPDGIYLAIVDIEMNNGEIVQISGDVLLIR